MVIQRKRYNLTIYRSLDYPLTLVLTGDYSDYTGLCECRATSDPTSALILSFAVTVGAYDAGSGTTNIVALAARADTAGVTQAKGEWSLVLINPDDIAEAYASGTVTFAHNPTGATVG